MAYNQYDVIVVPFPFTDMEATKKRPAIVLSNNKSFNHPAGHCICLMVTSVTSAWPLDVEIKDLESAGLNSASKMRMKIFTLDETFILRKAGALSSTDQKNLKTALGKLID
ncbi:MAG: type II toxin-antitoxin system PemK/MazF family toxin [Bdellovibrio sp.]